MSRTKKPKFKFGQKVYVIAGERHAPRLVDSIVGFDKPYLWHGKRVRYLQDCNTPDYWWLRIPVPVEVNGEVVHEDDMVHYQDIFPHNRQGKAQGLKRIKSFLKKDVARLKRSLAQAEEALRNA